MVERKAITAMVDVVFIREQSALSIRPARSTQQSALSIQSRSGHPRIRQKRKKQIKMLKNEISKSKGLTGRNLEKSRRDLDGFPRFLRD